MMCTLSVPSEVNYARINILTFTLDGTNSWLRRTNFVSIFAFAILRRIGFNLETKCVELALYAVLQYNIHFGST